MNRERGREWALYMFAVLSIIAIQIGILAGLEAQYASMLLNMIVWGMLMLIILPNDLTRYRPGDRVLLLSRGRCCWEDEDWVFHAGLRVGEVYTVVDVSTNSLTVEGGHGYHIDKCHFKRVKSHGK